MEKKFICEKISRLDIYLSEILENSRSQISNLIKNNFVKINNKICNKNSFKLNLNDEISVNLPEISVKKIEKNLNFDIEILYEDEEILVLNKPINLVIHEAPSVKEETLVDWLKFKGYMLSNLSGEIRAGIVHRLDKGTSGAIVVAKTNFAHQKLCEELKSKQMGRIYLAITDLALKEDCIINRPIGRNPSNRLKNAVVANGKDAKTAFINLQSQKKASLIAAKLFTGRTHQIRVHLSSINRHILGDSLYGFKGDLDKIGRIFLHAYFLYLTHPKSGEKIYIQAPVFGEFEEFLNNNFDKGNLNEILSKNYIFSRFDGYDKWLCYD